MTIQCYQTSTNINKYQQISTFKFTKINEYQQISTNINTQYHKKPTNINTYQQIATNNNKYQHSISPRINENQQISTNINKHQQISTTTNKYKQISTTGIWRNTKKYQQRQEKWRTIKEYQQISINIKVETVVDPPVAFQTHLSRLDTMRILCENDTKTLSKETGLDKK